MSLASLYETLCRTPSDIYEHLPTFVEVVEQIRATRVIELGVREGVSTIAWLHALRDRGHLWSVDVNFPSDAAPVRQVDVPWWTFVRGRDEDPATLAALPPECDVVFIDTSHTLEQTRRELELYGPRVRPGGRILLHDTGEDGVRVAIEEFVATRGFHWTNRPNCYGLGIIEVERRR